MLVQSHDSHAKFLQLICVFPNSIWAATVRQAESARKLFLHLSANQRATGRVLMVYQRMLIIFIIVQSNWHQLLSKPGKILIHTLFAWHTKFQSSSQVRAHPKQVLKLTMYMLSLATAVPRSWNSFLPTGTPCYNYLLHLEANGVIHTKGLSK